MYNQIMKRIPQKEREVQIIKRAEELGHEFIGFLDGYKNKESKLIIRCKKHGDWNPAIENYVRNGRCMQCVIESRTMSEDKAILKIQSNLNDNQTIIGCIGDYKNIHTKFKISCQDHGEWRASALHLVYSKSGCPKCGHEAVARKRRTPLNIVIHRINEILKKKEKYTFIGLGEEYKNSKSKVMISCLEHGEWSVDIATILANRIGCPSCAKSGFKPCDNAQLYIIRSDCGEFFKIGISNKVKRRITELKRSTPFGFHVLHVTNDIGSRIREMEKALHDEFESANMKGFNGATEWFLWSDAVNEKIKQL